MPCPAAVTIAFLPLSRSAMTAPFAAAAVGPEPFHQRFIQFNTEPRACGSASVPSANSGSGVTNSRRNTLSKTLGETTSKSGAAGQAA
jgi:hypothetical protein